jgi:hypothetical protein
MNGRALRQLLATAAQRRLRIVRLHHYMAGQLATDAEQRRIKHALLRRLSDITRHRDHQQHIHRRLVVADDDAGRD